MNQYLTPPEVGLVAYWPMNEGNGGVIMDFSGGGHEGDLRRTPWVTGAPLGDTSIETDDEAARIPATFKLGQNYPNPFNPLTTISYELPQKGKVSIKIIDLLGKEVATLVDRSQPAGTYRIQWRGLDKHGNPVASGLYFYSIVTGDFTKTRKMMLLR
jgi:hypothetical protein